MAVNMSGFDKNPFKVGDKVKVKAHVLRTWPHAFKNYIPIQYAVVTKLDSVHVFTDVDSDPTNFEHFELYEEPEVDVMTKPGTQQKTKRVPFSKVVWEKYKDVAKPYYNKQFVVSELTYFEGSTSAYTLAGVVAGQLSRFYESEIELEIPVTTKRIPFNPELKDAKVVCLHTSDELSEWVYMTSSVVCGVINRGDGGFTTELYHPNYLEMEIEVDA